MVKNNTGFAACETMSHDFQSWASSSFGRANIIDIIIINSNYRYMVLSVFVMSVLKGRKREAVYCRIQKSKDKNRIKSKYGGQASNYIDLKYFYHKHCLSNKYRSETNIRVD